METTATQERFFALAESFALQKPGASPWDADLLDANFAGASHGEKVTISFLLNVWNPGEEWKCGEFDLIDAIGDRFTDPTRICIITVKRSPTASMSFSQKRHSPAVQRYFCRR